MAQIVGRHLTEVDMNPVKSCQIPQDNWDANERYNGGSCQALYKKIQVNELGVA